jgi:hypothetical protein
MDKDPKIVKVEVVGPVIDIGAEACKAMPPGRRHRYKQAIKYILEDGRTFDSSCRGLTKPKLAANIQYSVNYADRGCLSAIVRDDELVGTSTTISLR